MSFFLFEVQSEVAEKDPVEEIKVLLVWTRFETCSISKH